MDVETDAAQSAAVDVSQWFAGRSRLLFIHAHPDDETITTGGTLAALAATGREPLVMTMTRGEQGEVLAGPLQSLAGTPELVVQRQTELATALGMLGVARHVFLGVPPARAAELPPYIYEDSGMAWSDTGEAIAAATVSDDALTRVPAAEPLRDVVAAAIAAQVQGIVSYDDGGGYGHPDHVRTHLLAKAAAQGIGVPFWEIVAADQLPGSCEAEERALRQTEGDTELYDISPWFDRKVAALRAYGTQLWVDGDEIEHVGGQRQRIDRVEGFRRL